MLIALTPEALIVKDFRPTTLASLTEGARSAMALELDGLSLAV